MCGAAPNDYYFLLLSYFTAFLLYYLIVLDFFLVNGYHAVGAHHGAAGAADATVVDGMGEIVALAVHFFRQLDALHGAHGYADSAAFAVLGIDNDLSFKCHNFSVIRLI